MTVELEKNGPVWTVIHNRPEAHNAMDPQSADALNQAFLEFDADATARVAVLYGEGGAFCAGWDPKYVSTLNEDYPLGELDIPPAAARGNDGEIPRGPLGPTRLELDKPVIAAIAGPAAIKSQPPQKQASTALSCLAFIRDCCGSSSLERSEPREAKGKT